MEFVVRTWIALAEEIVTLSFLRRGWVATIAAVVEAIVEHCSLDQMDLPQVIAVGLELVVASS